MANSSRNTRSKPSEAGVEAMKYSLRSLMIVVTLGCVLLGVGTARIEYLRRMAAFHKQEAKRYAKQIGIPESAGFAAYGNIRLSNPNPARADIEAWGYHARLALNFERAKKRPWMPVENLEP